MIDTFGNSITRHMGNQQMHRLVDNTSFIGWPGETMVEWVVPCQYGSHGHFLDDGHKKVADKIYEYIRNIGWVA
jgi:hypothetical protein